MPRGRGNTRNEIIDVALRMFVEQGYDATSLREIAEAIGVTKAALYYHFRTKDEIVRAAFEAHSVRIEAVLDWLERTPPGADRDEGLVQRLQAVFTGESGAVMRFSQVNQTAMTREEFGKVHLDQIRRLVRLVVGGEPDAEREIRAMLTFGAVVVGTLGTPEAGVVTAGSADDRRAASQRVALELLAGIRT